MTDTDLAFASIEEVARLYRKRKLSPVDVTKLILARIDQLNPKLNAYITVTAELALAQAKKAEAELFAPRGRKGHRDRGPLHGIPISLKDNIYTKDIRTTAGSKILKDFVPLHDAVVWAKLREAGAILLGKTNLHEFAYGVTTNNPHYGPTRNPWDLARIPGGSSGGSAAAVAAGLCYGSIGTDTGGSIRIPASLCGIVGLKPSFGRVSTMDPFGNTGVLPLSWSLDHVGPLARNAVDAAIILSYIAGPALALDGNSSASVQHAIRLISLMKSGTEVRRKIGKLILLRPKEFFWDHLDSEVRASVDSVFSKMEHYGVGVEEVTLSHVSEAEEPATNIALAEALAYHESRQWFPYHATDYGDDVRQRLEMGRKVSAKDYLLAPISRDKLRWDLAQLLKKPVNARDPVKIFVVPTCPIAAPLIGQESVTFDSRNVPVRASLLRLNRPANFAGWPAISIPCGFTRSGLPIGLQLFAHLRGEPGLLRAAALLQKHSDWHLCRPRWPCDPEHSFPSGV